MLKKEDFKIGYFWRLKIWLLSRKTEDLNSEKFGLLSVINYITAPNIDQMQLQVTWLSVWIPLHSVFFLFESFGLDGGAKTSGSLGQMLCKG